MSCVAVMTRVVTFRIACSPPRAVTYFVKIWSTAGNAAFVSVSGLTTVMGIAGKPSGVACPL